MSEENDWSLIVVWSIIRASNLMSELSTINFFHVFQVFIYYMATLNMWGLRCYSRGKKNLIAMLWLQSNPLQSYMFSASNICPLPEMRKTCTSDCLSISYLMTQMNSGFLCRVYIILYIWCVCVCVPVWDIMPTLTSSEVFLNDDDIQSTPPPRVSCGTRPL